MYHRDKPADISADVSGWEFQEAGPFATASHSLPEPEGAPDAMREAEDLSSEALAKEEKAITRRRFLGLAAAGMGGILVGCGRSSVEAESVPGRSAADGAADSSRVVVVRSEKALADEKINRSVVDQMVKKGLLSLTREKSEAEAWKRFASKGDVVAIKVNGLGERRLKPFPEVIQAIIEGLKSAGVRENDIIIWDRFKNSLLEWNAFPLNSGGEGVRCLATEGEGPECVGLDPAVGYDPGDGNKSHFSRMVTQIANKIINVAVLKDHPETGVTLALKNISFGAVDATGRFHASNCDPSIAEICAHPALRNKCVLHVIEGLRGIYNGGPRNYHTQWVWNYGGLIFSTDPVALDTIGLGIIEDKRKKEGKLPLAQVTSEVYTEKTWRQDPKHIATAARMGLGVNDPKRIKVIRLTV